MNSGARRFSGSQCHGGALTVIGLGIRAHQHLTSEAREALSVADQVMYLVGDPMSEAAILELAPSAQSLHHHYRATSRRREFYKRIGADVASAVKTGDHVCLATYGHPTVGVDPVAEAIRLVRAASLPARVLAGVSSLACLFADLEVDPMVSGLQAYEATKFLQSRPAYNSDTPLVLWQIGTVGNNGWPAEPSDDALNELIALLGASYGMDHSTIIYEASSFEMVEARVDAVPIHELSDVTLTLMSTLYVPAIAARSSKR